MLSGHKTEQHVRARHTASVKRGQKKIFGRQCVLTPCGFKRSRRRRSTSHRVCARAPAAQRVSWNRHESRRGELPPHLSYKTATRRHRRRGDSLWSKKGGGATSRCPDETARARVRLLGRGLCCSPAEAPLLRAPRTTGGQSSPRRTFRKTKVVAGRRKDDNVGGEGG